MTSKRTIFQTVEFALVICRCPFENSPHYNKWLAVKESKNRGWWIPAGAVDSGESFLDGAKRECWEEAHMKIDLKGILKIDHKVDLSDNGRMRVIFYAEPTDIEAAHDFKIPEMADKESVEARWITLQELKQLTSKENCSMTGDQLRGDELFVWADYLESGGQVFPLEILSLREGYGLDPRNHRTCPVFENK